MRPNVQHLHHGQDPSWNSSYHEADFASLQDSLLLYAKSSTTVYSVHVHGLIQRETLEWRANKGSTDFPKHLKQFDLYAKNCTPSLFHDREDLLAECAVLIYWISTGVSS